MESPPGLRTHALLSTNYNIGLFNKKIVLNKTSRKIETICTFAFYIFNFNLLLPFKSFFISLLRVNIENLKVTNY